MEKYLEKLIDIKRNTKVTKGGRIFSFSAISVIGNKKNKIGIGIGKAKEVPIAIQKSIEKAKLNLKHINIYNNTIKNIIITKFCSTKVILIPTKTGSGLITSNTIKPLFEVIGIKNIKTKCLGSKNKYNTIKATIKALNNIK